MKRIMSTLLTVMLFSGLAACSLNQADSIAEDFTNKIDPVSSKEFIIEGDMILNTDNPVHYDVIKQYYPEAVYTGPEESESSKSLFKANDWNGFPFNGVVFYRLRNVSGELKTRLLRAMSTIQLVSYVRFVENDIDEYSVTITDTGNPGNGGSSTVGLVKHPLMNLLSQSTIGTCIHQLYHILGFWHENQRKIRDSYVTTAASVLNNTNYVKITDGKEFGTYDYESIMHAPYSSVLNMGSHASAYQRTHLSSTDIMGLCAMYGGYVYDNPIFFNAAYYLNRYADLKKVFGNDFNKARQHWLKYGIKEGRQGSPVFHAQYYANRYPDIKNAYGTDYTKILLHFYVFGLRVSRQGSPQFNAAYYMGRYSDLYNAFNSANYILAANHFINNGIREGRVGAP